MLLYSSLQNFKLMKYISHTFTLIILLLIGCSRDNPESINNPPEVQKIFPTNEISLTIPEPSGIAYNSVNNSLMIVSDGRPDIYEIDFSGNILSSIISAGADMEGICLSKNCDTIYVVEEKKKLITSFDLSGSKLFSFSVDVATSDNSALEGITINKLSNTLYTINEKDPSMILAYTGSTELWRKLIDYTSDISDIYYEESENCFWVISDESSRILKLNINAALINQWEIPFTKGEGITVVNDKLYVVNDSNAKMYVFQKPE